MESMMYQKLSITHGGLVNHFGSCIVFIFVCYRRADNVTKAGALGDPSKCENQIKSTDCLTEQYRQLSVPRVFLENREDLLCSPGRGQEFVSNVLRIGYVL